MKGKHCKENSKKENSSQSITNSKNTSFSNNEKKKRNLYPIFLLTSIIITGICVIYIFRWVQESKHNEEIMDVVKEAVIEYNNETVIEDSSNEEIENSNAPEKVINFNKLKELNSDVVGWVRVNNTNIDYPVVKCDNNSFYLDHSFDKTYNRQGWPFVDYEVKLDGTDKNITIYGHNIKNGSMFGSLKKILNEDWYENAANLNISYINEEEKAIYRVFSIYKTEKELYYTTNNFKNGTEYQRFLDELISRSVVDFNVDLDKEDQILTLSTCADNNQYRVVLHAVKL